jgi:hypothetical protein
VPDMDDPGLCDVCNYALNRWGARRGYPYTDGPPKTTRDCVPSWDETRWDGWRTKDAAPAGGWGGG